MSAPWKPRHGGTLLIGLLIVVIVALALFAARTRTASRRASTAGTASVRTNGTSGMREMAGMRMSSDSSVTLTPDQIRQFGITFDTAKVRPLVTEMRADGYVTFDETRLAQVAPKFGGYIERLYVETTGQPVHRGQPLAAIYSPELVAAQQDLLVARGLERTLGQSVVPGVAAQSTDLAGAARRRLELWDISGAQIQQVLSTGRVQRTMTLFSPASGVVIDKRVVQGQAIQPGEELYAIAELSTVWVDVQLREMDAASVRTGSAAEITVTGVPARSFSGRVAYVYPTLDTAARAIRARIVVPNPMGMLKPGMYATVHLSTPSRSALTVPSSAVLRTGERNLVFIDLGGGRLLPRDVQLGPTAGDYTEILAGVDAGQRVVTSAQFLLDSESNLGEVMKSMIGMSAGATDQSMQDMPGMYDKGADMRGVQGMSNMQMPARPTRSAPRK